MKSLLTPYRVMANVVGVLLIILVLIGLPLHYGHVLNEGLFPEGGTAETLGADISRYLGVAHGWLYMIFLVVAFSLSRRARWDFGFTAVTLLGGTVPILSFWAEHRATADVRRRIAAQEAPQQAGTRETGAGQAGTGSSSTEPSQG